MSEEIIVTRKTRASGKPLSADKQYEVGKDISPGDAKTLVLMGKAKWVDGEPEEQPKEKTRGKKRGKTAKNEE